MDNSTDLSPLPDLSEVRWYVVVPCILAIFSLAACFSACDMCCKGQCYAP